MTDQRTASYQIVDEGSLHKYRTEIPNTVIRGLTGRGLSLPARWLYVYLKSVAGDSGESWQNTTTLAKGAQLGRGTIARAKRELIKACLIAVESQGHNAHATDRIRILDIWTDNMREFATPHCSPHEQSQVPLSADVHTCNGSDCSPQKHYCSPQKHYCSPQEPKEDLFKKIPRRRKTSTRCHSDQFGQGDQSRLRALLAGVPAEEGQGLCLDRVAQAPP
jgi:Helix-turn-helix domain